MTLHPGAQKFPLRVSDSESFVVHSPGLGSRIGVGLVGAIKMLSDLDAIFIICCCFTNYPKFSTLRQKTFIISQFLWVRNQEQLRWVPDSLFRGYSLCVCRTCSLLRRLCEERGRGTCTKLTHRTVGRIQLLPGCWAWGFSCWLLAEGHLQCLAMWASP